MLQREQSILRKLNRMKHINICLACDDNYSKYAGVVIASVLANSNQDTYLNFYILDGGISQKHKSEINDLKSIKGCEINFIPINDDDFSEYKKVKTHKYITLATYYRLKLPSLLPDVERVIYLDCDTIVNSDLTELYNIHLTTQAFAGVLDINMKNFDNQTYINAGVLVMDLNKMRELNLEQAFLEWTEEHQTSIECGDQEIINEVCKGNIFVVPDTWNVQTSDFMNRSSFIKKPNIIHYIAKNKPFNSISLCYFKNFYLKYLQMTPWKKSKLEVFIYKYCEQILSIFKFIIHRPTFFLQSKFYRAFYKTYLVRGECYEK